MYTGARDADDDAVTGVQIFMCIVDYIVKPLNISDNCIELNKTTCKPLLEPAGWSHVGYPLTIHMCTE